MATSTMTDYLKLIWRYALEFALLGAAVAIILQLSWPAVSAWRERPRPGRQVRQDSDSYPHLVYLPQQYGHDNQRWPLLLFLHGAGERGNDLQMLLRTGPPKLISQGRHFPMIVVAPQCAPNSRWHSSELLQLLDHVVKRYAVDANRVYVTGYSMGGYGTWELGVAAPDRLAAIAPLCGGGDPTQASRLAALPVWAFHGAQDDVVPVSATRQMVDAMEATGAQPKTTVYPKLGHNIWDRTYRMPELYDWLLSHQKRKTL
jgi:predicted peptidase